MIKILPVMSTSAAKTQNVSNRNVQQQNTNLLQSASKADEVSFGIGPKEKRAIRDELKKRKRSLKDQNNKLKKLVEKLNNGEPIDKGELYVIKDTIKWLKERISVLKSQLSQLGG